MMHVPDVLTIWLIQYGSFALFALLALGILALPIPDETLMVFSGILIAHGKLALIPTIIASYAGALCGISLSYIIGRTAGTYLVKKYGHWLRITPAKMARIHNWFERIGKWSLCIGYFIAGVRHVTGYAAGTTQLSYRQFALFAYSGAIVWASTFLAIGYFLGNRWTEIMQLLEDQWYNAAAVSLILAVIYLIYKIRKRRKVTRATLK